MDLDSKKSMSVKLIKIKVEIQFRIKYEIASDGGFLIVCAGNLLEKPKNYIFSSCKLLV